MTTLAPIPNISSVLPTHTLDIKLPSINIKSYYIRLQKSRFRGRYEIESYLKTKYNLAPISYDFLPNKHVHCVFFWIPLVRCNDIDHTLSLSSDEMPCIAFVPTQGKLCQKAAFAQTLYDYYGNDAWKYTPKTFYVCYDDDTKHWQISDHLKSVLNGVWITKTSTGSLGQNMYLFSGHSLKSLESFLQKNYTQKMEHKSERYRYLREYQEYINSNHLLNSVIIQQYLNKPLLYDKHYKFDIRIYALLATTNPSVLFYKFAKLRICVSEYNDVILENPVDDEYDEKEVNITNKEELSKHITNSTISRGNKDYDKKTGSINGRPTVADYNGFIQFMYNMAVNNKQFDIEWFETERYKQLYMENKLSLDDIERLIDMKFSKTLSAVYDAAKESFDNDCIVHNRQCQFLLHGNDIMLDENGKFWMLEINQTPTMFKDTDMRIKNLMKGLLKESIDIVMEIRDLKLDGFKVDQYTPLKTRKLWNKGHLDYKNTSVNMVDSVINNIDVMLNE